MSENLKPTSVTPIIACKGTKKIRTVQEKRRIIVKDMAAEVIKKPLYHNLLRFKIVVNSYFYHHRNEGYRRGCDRRCEGLGGVRRDASEN